MIRERGECLILVETYQSSLVLNIIKSGRIYRAHKNLRNDYAYRSLIDILHLHCECPIFGCLKYHKKNTNGRISNSVKMTLDVPKQFIHLTEYSVWADFMYSLRYTKPDHYKQIVIDNEEVTQREMNHLIYSLKKQRRPWAYRVPQVILEEIRPEWLVKYQTGSTQGPLEGLKRWFGWTG